MGSARLFSVIMLVAGAILLAVAYQQSGSFGDQTKHFFTGNYRDGTTWMIVIGAIVGVLGLAGLVAPIGRGDAIA